MEIFKRVTEIDFMGKKGVAVTLSSLVILIGIVSILIHGGLKYGIDFAGGTLVQLKFKNPPVIEDVRDGLKTIGLGDSEIQEFGSKSHILIRVERSEAKLEEVGTRIKNSLSGKYSAEEIVIERVEMVGPKVGKDLREKAILSIIYAIIGIVIYISWRFEFQYAIAAIIALIHDVMVTMGVFSVADKEFTLVIVAAFLAIIGYSLNDTIVIFDRIRENMRRRGKKGQVEVINTSINQTLSRTILTSGTTLLVVAALFLLGGEIIHDFSFALMVGVFVGTYSSIFIASVFLVYWAKRSSTKRA
ncbi:MAG TPA: protein translocase subunit SecF [Nitrospinaceae bacterium]|jgi:preprotein translocase subunit SecF|nr:protein translocase subunit SecF [Nitrospinaceae bacterium]MDP7108766.1 protein translocase subunit SecF [Nitrospinaceae bacterium]HJL72738.1 protein translocase subunit SecF [Nitrospinaceae bacterium]HJN99670.1 protein translocase subunit SecF [Nitrospinaceae bacterium]|tara:strand:+ start:2274 stop:3179 length:906 start_codon:yes stop_codon:yes gene_type:complete